jgi:hypothetical protein
MRTTVPIKRVDHKLLKRKLEQTLKDAIKDRDVVLVRTVSAQLRQYGEVRRG